MKKIYMIFLCLICGVLSVLYGLSVKMIGTGTRFYMVWLLLGFFFFLLAYAVKKEWFSRLPSLPRKIILLALSLGLMDTKNSTALTDAELELQNEFLQIQTFDEYLKNYHKFYTVKSNSAVFAHRMRLLDTDKDYTHREKEKLCAKKKTQLVKEFFGGREALYDNQKRDLRKKMRCEQQQVRLIYWDYYEPVTEEWFLSFMKPQILGEITYHVYERGE